MAAPDLKLYLNTLKLVTDFLKNRNNPEYLKSFTEKLQNPITELEDYPGYKLNEYVWFIASLNPSAYRNYITPPMNIAKFTRLIYSFWRDPQGYKRLNIAYLRKEDLFTDEEASALEKIEKEPDEKKKEESFHKFLEKKAETLPSEGLQTSDKKEEPSVEEKAASTGPKDIKEPIKSHPKRSTDEDKRKLDEILGNKPYQPEPLVKPSGEEIKYSIPEPVREAASEAISQGQIKTGRLVNNAQRGLGSMAKGAFSLGGKGVRNVAAGVGRGSARAVSGFAARGLITAGVGFFWPIVVAIFIAFGLFFIPLILESTGFLSPQTPTLEASPLGNISSCQFTRGDHNPKTASYKSPLLLGYFEEASALTKIPAVVLAAFTRVESPGSVNFTDEDIRNYRCIREGPQRNVSPTGALGIMQLQPQGTTGHAADAVANGARLIGIDYNSLTEADYCDVRKNIIMGAGFILKKMSYNGFGDGTVWNQQWTTDKPAITALVKGYYGCDLYPSCQTGPYSYAEDVLASIQSCQTSQLASGQIIPVGEGGAKIASAARQIAEQLIHSTNPGMAGCNPGGDYGPSYHCWVGMGTEASQKYDQANDPDYLQCTEFVWAAFDKAGFGSQINEIRGGNAGDWPNLARNNPNWTVFEDPNQLQPGDIISLGQGGIVSHVAVVIEREGNTIKVAQAATSAAIETHHIENGQLIVPTAGASGARTGVKGFIRMKSII